MPKEPDIPAEQPPDVPQKEPVRELPPEHLLRRRRNNRLKHHRSRHRKYPRSDLLIFNVRRLVAKTQIMPEHIFS